MTHNGIFIRLSVPVALQLLLIGCTADETLPVGDALEGVPIRLTATLQTTRVADELQDTRLSTAVTMGVFGLSDGNTIANGDNAAYAVDADGNLNAMSGEMTWQDNRELGIIAYSPRQDSWDYRSAEHVFAVAADQSNATGYLDSDLLYASVTTEPQATVSLGFTHLLSRIALRLSTDNSASLTDATVSIAGTLPTTKVSLADGGIDAASGTPTDIVVGSGISLGAGGSTTLYGIVVPQTLGAGITLVEISDQSRVLRYSLSDAMVLESGQSYTLDVNISSSTIGSTLGNTATIPALAGNRN